MARSEYVAALAAVIIASLLTPQAVGALTAIQQIHPAYQGTPPSISVQTPTATYPMREFTLNVTLNDADGWKNLVNATVLLNELSIKLKWDNATNTFSKVQDTYGYAVLNTAKCLRTVINDTAVKLTFNLYLTWSAPPTSVSLTVVAFDAVGLSTTKTFANAFTFEPRLYVQSATAPSRVEPGEYFIISGKVYHYSSQVPPTGFAVVPDNQTWIYVIKGLHGDGLIHLRFFPYGSTIKFISPTTNEVVKEVIIDNTPNQVGLVEDYVITLPSGNYLIVACTPLGCMNTTATLAGGDALAPHLYTWYFDWGQYIAINPLNSMDFTQGVWYLYTRSNLVQQATGGAPRVLLLRTTDYSSYVQTGYSTGGSGLILAHKGANGVYVQASASAGLNVWLNGKAVVDFVGMKVWIYNLNTNTSNSASIAAVGKQYTYGMIASSQTDLNQFKGYISYAVVCYNNNCKSGNTITASGLKLFLDPSFFNGTKYIDLSGNNNHGTPYNMYAPSYVSVLLNGASVGSSLLGLGGSFGVVLKAPSTVGRYTFTAVPKYNKPSAGNATVSVIVDRPTINSISFTASGEPVLDLRSAYDGATLNHKLKPVDNDKYLIYDIDYGFRDRIVNVYTRYLRNRVFRVAVADNRTVYFDEIKDDLGLVSFTVSGPATVLVWVGKLGTPKTVLLDGKRWDGWSYNSSTKTLFISVTNSTVTLIFEVGYASATPGAFFDPLDVLVCGSIAVFQLTATIYFLHRRSLPFMLAAGTSSMVASVLALASRAVIQYQQTVTVGDVSYVANYLVPNQYARIYVFNIAFAILMLALWLMFYYESWVGRKGMFKLVG